MALDIPSSPPALVYRGARFEFECRLTDYPTADWDVVFRLYGAGPTSEEAAAVETAPDTYTVTVDVGAGGGGELDLALGYWSWQLVATSAGAEGVRVVSRGLLEVVAGPEEAVAPDTHASRMLVLIESALEGKIPRDSESYSINGRSVSRIPTSELVSLRDRYRAERASEIRALEAGVRPGRYRRIVMGFRG